MDLSSTLRRARFATRCAVRWPPHSVLHIQVVVVRAPDGHMLSLFEEQNHDTEENGDMGAGGG